MEMNKTVFITGFLLMTMILLGFSEAVNWKQAQARQNNNEVVNVYGPGGPLGPMEELAKQFKKETGINVNVIGGAEAKWIDQAKQDADIIYGGSEYMLRDIMLKYPGMIDEKTRTELYPRAAGILVRKGNPKNIQSLEDLAKSGVKIIDVNGAGQLGLWEDLAGRKGLISRIDRNIAVSVKTSAEAIELWKANSKYDAWITYESWHYRLKNETDLVQFPEEDKLYRGTPVSITSSSDNKKESKQFIEYLKTESSHQVFQKWGWK
ncbi:hypothetical protein AWH48_00875 [Domibacillus aminovorans]|uniref:ABC transporter substrate-binding protein n=2 Tax=Domibacillus aminovorans TaxID=29332 RepID=A0A177L2T7_9BACI|nr:extracellular solute-binding protein [Domibacillus aminovorans]OAH59692.1 hypothetical protein AWH48_00875 [Domibacillus aminovorans]